MLAEYSVLDQRVTQAQELSPSARLRLIQRLQATLITPLSPTQQPLICGKYATGRMSTLADFAIAEWHPTDQDERDANLHS